MRKATRVIMGMPITVEIVGSDVPELIMEQVFAYFSAIDETFSTYKEGSEISRINQGLLALNDASEAVKKIFLLAEETKVLTGGYFDIESRDGMIDPSGIVK